MPRLAILLAVGSVTCLMAQPRYASDGHLILPSDYREWIFVSSGLGMSYALGRNAPPAFTNVFANPSAYRSFLSTGTWPDKTTLVLEVRASSTKGSINQAGSYQSEVLAVEAEVKDATKFPGNGWAFFAFGKSSTGRQLPRTEDCYSCHLAHGAVDNTFVQFYPVLLDVAKQKGTLKP
jgi:hypothetical protein